MPLEAVLSRPDGQPLGSRSEVMAAISAVFPNAEWNQRTESIETILKSADPSSQESFASLPADTRAWMDRLRTTCLVKCPGATLEMYAFDDELLRHVQMNIYGIVHPTDDLARLTR